MNHFKSYFFIWRLKILFPLCVMATTLFVMGIVRADSSGVSVSDWRTDKFKDGLITVEHSYWGKMYPASSNSTGYAVGKIKLTDISVLNSKRITRLLITLDDDGKAWDAILVNSSGTPVEPTVVDVSDIIRKKNSTTISYWWRPKYFGAGPLDEKFKVKFNIIVTFSVDKPNHAGAYKLRHIMFQSKGKVVP